MLVNTSIMACIKKLMTAVKTELVDVFQQACSKHKTIRLLNQLTVE